MERGVAKAGALLSAPWAPVLAAVVLAALFVVQSAFTVNGEVSFSLFDDAMISMRYARSLVDGHGLVWNPGEAPVEGYSNLLWTLWMAALHLLRLPDAKASLPVMLSGVAIVAANVVVVRRLVREIAPETPLAVTLAGWLVALDHNLAYWTLRGLEVGLIALLVSFAALLAVRLAKVWSRRTLVTLAGVMILGVLTRDDTLPAWLVVAAYVAVCGPRAKAWRGALWLCGAALGAFGAHVLLRMAYYGAPLPNTYYLKMYRIPALLRWRTGARALAEVGLFCLPVTLGLCASLTVRRPRNPGVTLLGCLFLVQCAYSVHAGGDAFEHEILVNRFVSVALPALFGLSAIALATLLGGGDAGLSRRRWTGAAWGLLVPVAVWSLHAHSPFGGSAGLRLSRIAVAVGAAIVAVVVQRRGPGGLRSEGVRACVAGACVLAIAGPAAVRSLAAGPLWADEEAGMVRYGVALGEATAPRATLAITWAGAIPYFARRTSIDLMGKCDAVIARGPPLSLEKFAPGHDKWDMDYSVGRLRPDVVAQVTEDDAALLKRMEGWGYVRVGPEVFVRADSTAVDRAALLRAACVVPWGRDDIWGYFGDPAAVWRERWERECAGGGQSAPPRP